MSVLGGRSLQGLGIGRRPSIPDRPAFGSVVARARGIGVALGGRRVLDDVDLDIRAGQLLALVGPNGAGKSTLLAILAGDLTGDAGAVELFDRPLPDWSPAELSLRRSVLTQSVSVSFPFTVREVVEMGRTPWRNTSAAVLDESLIADAVRTADVAHLVDRRFTELSGGERARVALARVLAQSVPFVLLDEPTASLDVRHQELVLGVARERAREGDAVVVVLHDLALAAAYADQVAILADTRLVASGPPDRVLTPDLLTSVYQHGIEVIAHPRTGAPVVLPIRDTPAQHRSTPAGTPAGTPAAGVTSHDSATAGTSIVHTKETTHPMSTTEQDARSTSERFSETLRSATSEDHEAALVSTYITELFGGKLSQDEYAAMVVQHYYAYVVLEEAAETMRTDPLAAPFVIDGLTRVPAIRADLEYLFGPDWESMIAPSSSTIEYCERMKEVCSTEPEAFIAHHYTRYMGDLSGGQMIARVVRRAYELPDGAGAAFYDFDQIGDIGEFKARYRTLLDDAPFDAEGSQRMLDEVAAAYRLNANVLLELDSLLSADRAK